jgi:hypothetical protein
MQVNSASHKVITEYTGISTKDSQTVSIIKHDDPILSSQILFWKQFIQPRQPCLVDASTTQSSTLWKMNKSVLENVAGDQVRTETPFFFIYYASMTIFHLSPPQDGASGTTIGYTRSIWTSSYFRSSTQHDFISISCQVVV